MFDKLTINLGSPICACNQPEKLGWNFSENKKVIFLNIFCNVCDAELKIPSHSLTAQFSISCIESDGPDGGGEPVNNEVKEYNNVFKLKIA